MMKIYILLMTVTKSSDKKHRKNLLKMFPTVLTDPPYYLFLLYVLIALPVYVPGHILWWDFWPTGSVTQLT